MNGSGEVENPQESALIAGDGGGGSNWFYDICDESGGWVWVWV
jgi:hypothetical protein